MPELEQNPATPLLDALLNYTTLKRRRFHVPAHVGNAFWTGELAEKADALGLQTSLIQHDLSELEGLDVLSTPEGVIAESQALTALRCGVAHSFYLINGASVGLHAALMTAFQPEDVVLMPRNVHRAVTTGRVMTGIRPAWFTPTWEADWGIWGAVTLEQLEEVFTNNPTAQGVVITSPTYEGIVSDIDGIAQWCQTKGIRLIVDEAHGSLFGHTPSTPPSATQFQGVDAVIQSFHKTAGSLTQSAVLHLPHGSSLSSQRLQDALNHLQSTSPNYLLLASLDLSSAWLGSLAGQAQRQSLWRNIKAIRERIHGMTAFQLLETPNGKATSLDKLRLYLRHAYLNGQTWADELEQDHGISYELANPYGALFLGQIGHTPADFVAFMQGLQAVAKSHPKHLHPQYCGEATSFFEAIETPVLPEVDGALSPRDAFFSVSERLAVDEQLIGRLSGETVVSCPPGIPVLLGGERIQATHLPFLTHRDDLFVLV
jgi:arginine/lysine/ornithine decarboxylase